MTSVLGYARTFFIGGHYRPESLPSLNEELVRFHGMLEELARHIEAGTPLLQGMSAESLVLREKKTIHESTRNDSN